MDVAAALCALRMVPRERMPEVDNLSTARGGRVRGLDLIFLWAADEAAVSATSDGRTHGLLFVKVQCGLILTLR